MMSDEKNLSYALKQLLQGNVKRYREMNSMTQQQLAEDADLSTSYIGAIETGIKSPSLYTLERISLALGIEVRQIFTPDAAITDVYDKNDLFLEQKGLKKAVSDTIDQFYKKKQS